MVDSGINLHLLPERPTIGYKEFNLNPDNFILLARGHKVRTKIDLIADDGTGVKIYSEDSDPTALQDITVSLNKLNLGEVTSVLPYYLPQMTGILNGDFHVIQNADGQLSMVSDMAVHVSAEGGRRSRHRGTTDEGRQRDRTAHGNLLQQG